MQTNPCERLFDVRELEEGLHSGNKVCEVIKTPAYAMLHREEPRDYFTCGRAIYGALVIGMQEKKDLFTKNLDDGWKTFDYNICN